MSRPLSVIGGFFLRALLWLGVALGVWFWAREYVVAPVAWLASLIMHQAFPGWVYGTDLDGIRQSLLTTIAHPLGTQEKPADFAPVARVLSYCYGLPLLCALLLASRAKGVWWKLPLGWVLLIPFQAWGVCFQWLMVLAVQYGEVTHSATGFSVWHVNLIALGYQVGYLLFPTLIPMLIWVYVERAFIVTVAVDGAMFGSLQHGGSKRGEPSEP